MSARLMNNYKGDRIDRIIFEILLMVFFFSTVYCFKGLYLSKIFSQHSKTFVKLLYLTLGNNEVNVKSQNINK